MKKVLYLTNIPSPYIVDFLNELGKLCNLTAVFERNDSLERDESWRHFWFDTFQGIILHGWKVGTDAALSIGVLRYLKRDRYDEIIINNPCTPTGMIAIFWLRAVHIKYSIISEGGIAKSGKGIKESIKKFLFSDAKLYFSTGWKGDEYFTAYGAKSERIRWFPFTSLYRNEILPSALDMNEKEHYKRIVGCNTGKMILYVGRFIYGKGIDVLLKAFAEMQGDNELDIVGGRAPEEYLMLIDKLGIQNIRFINFSNKERLINYYKAADIVVLPTRSDTWGLVIPEAMSLGVPVISTNQCVAALTLIKENVNGYVVPADDVDALYKKIYLLLNDDEIRKKMAEENIKKMQDYSLERMAECVLGGLSEASNGK